MDFLIFYAHSAHTHFLLAQNRKIVFSLLNRVAGPVSRVRIIIIIGRSSVPARPELTGPALGRPGLAWPGERARPAMCHLPGCF